MTESQDVRSSHHSRGYLPHIADGDLTQVLTFQLADAVPLKVLRRVSVLSVAPDSRSRARALLQATLDSGLGACWLRRPDIAALVQDALGYFDGRRYDLKAWVIMPNHVHVVLRLHGDEVLSKVMHSLKSFTAHRANKLLGRSGRFWNKEYYDRFIRDENHMNTTIRYIHRNPVTAGLVENPEDWPWSSARLHQK